MEKDLNNINLNDLIELCCATHESYRDQAWMVFIKRYKMYIYNKTYSVCRSWNVQRLKGNLSDTVNDIVSEVYAQLVVNDCRALQSFLNRDNERMFLSWLGVICSRCVDRYVRKKYNESLSLNDFDLVEKYVGSLNFDKRWELYEFYIQKFRDSSKTTRKNLERDINIFNLYTWGDFDSRMIKLHPCLNTLGPRVVDVVVNRMRNYLRNERISES